MKTVADFKRKMQVGAKVNSQLFRKQIDGSFAQINDITNRECVISQSNSFALTFEKTDGTKEKSWCDWPKAKEFTPIDENTAQVIFWEGTGKLIYQFI